ncbi:CobW family GTP-binding protein [Thiosulfativibrio zosterae]|uniref:Cobalamin biosynthesis protein CobW n=1 Tax=Thiosulfativibrio zosterae TaxID=2675053 RepID=A0A6F8PLA5_9GAMM|nr:GTP-binding protein [Thiosulfativibrio zosterae]BBP42893.1 cobalamin biosynthesis protein CobW [Thiosulfativibrio zosterae]
MIKVNIICGPLGSGKTTLVKQLLEQKPSDESWAVLVNEFGSIGIDGAILSDAPKVMVTQMPGGCICCSAKGELKTTIEQLIQQMPNLDRLLIEPTGLGEPDSLVDLFKDAELSKNFEVQTLFSVFDIAHTSISELKSLTIMQSLLSMADILVLNKQDLATPEQTDSLKHYCETLYPPKQAILTTSHSQLDPSYLSHSHRFISGFRLQPHAPTSINTIAHQHASTQVSTELPYQPLELPCLLNRAYKHQLGVASIGWIFTPELVFNWMALKNLFENLQKQPGLVKRAKGVLRAGAPWMLFQYAAGEVTREYIAYRQDSRLELLLESPADFDFIGFEKLLMSCIKEIKD